MTIDAYASWRHMADHIAPIWLALPDEVRGTFYAPVEVAQWAPRAGAPFPVDVTVGFPDRKATDRLVLVAGFADHFAVRPRPTVLVNHGAGQSYQAGKGPEAYSGGPGRDRVALHLEPGQLAARATAAAGYPYAEVGCPRLDLLHAFGAHPVGELVAIAIRQHDPPQSIPEQRSAWLHYADRMPELAERFDLLGHGHPRGWERTEQRWAKLGVRSTPDSYDVLDDASVLVTDTSSIGWEFASTGRPVIWCQAPWYRADACHGGRFVGYGGLFGDALPGYVVSEPYELAPTIEKALAEPFDPAWWAAVDSVYAFRDGKAAARAADAIVALLAT